MQFQELQRRLAGLGLYDGEIDGRDGPLTRAAIVALLLARPVARGDWRRWSAKRRAIAARQIICLLEGIEPGAIDGLVGPQTLYAFEIYRARRSGLEIETWRDAEPSGADAAAARWPRQSQSAMRGFFGPVGANQATLEFPYPMKLAWDRTKQVTRCACHAKVRAPARRVLTRVLRHYGRERVTALGLDLFGGCLNVRRMRGGSAWSTHAWGAAFDFDPGRNQLRWNARRARFARPEYERWWELWEAEGFLSLGRTRDFDWMHVQAARL